MNPASQFMRGETWHNRQGAETNNFLAANLTSGLRSSRCRTGAAGCWRCWSSSGSWRYRGEGVLLQPDPARGSGPVVRGTYMFWSHLMSLAPAGPFGRARRCARIPGAKARYVHRSECSFGLGGIASRDARGARAPHGNAGMRVVRRGNGGTLECGSWRDGDPHVRRANTT